jgi:LCP family protein required for cell wall assembly
MSLTGYAWAAMQGLVNGLTVTDVIDPSNAAADKPADGARDILLVGMDSRTDAQGNPLSQEVLDELNAGESDGELNTDTLIMVHIPNDGSKAVAISLPRDSFVQIPGYGQHKINSAYADGYAKERETLTKQGDADPKDVLAKANQAGAKVLIATIEQLTGSTIDNYASINLLGFSDITKAIGGVDVCLKDNVDDSYSGAKFTKGEHTISGVQALEFVRQRHGLPRGDLDRVVRQQVFMASMAKSVLSAGTLANPAKLADLIDAIKKSVVLNQNWDILSFAQQMKGLTGGQLQFETIPVVNPDYTTTTDGSAVEVDASAVRDFVQGITGGAGSTPATPNKDTTVEVDNGTSKGGLAATVSQALVAKGFTAGITGNTTARKTTAVHVPVGQKSVGQAVATALGGNAVVVEDKTVDVGHAVVLIGTDYAPPTSVNANAPASPPPSAPAAPSSGDQTITANGVTCVN